MGSNGLAVIHHVFTHLLEACMVLRIQWASKTQKNSFKMFQVHLNHLGVEKLPPK